MTTDYSTTKRPLTFSEREWQCEELFRSRGPFYHLCTPGDSALVLFETEDDFRYAMNLLASSIYHAADVNPITFEAMRTHLHLIGEGPVAAAMEWFSRMRKRLCRFYQSTGRVRNLVSFQAEVFPINNLAFLRNSIAYVNRNGYLVHPEHTPFSYPWGANRFFFNPDAQLRCDREFGSLFIREKRKMFGSHVVDYPGEAPVIDGYVSPAYYCDLSLGEGIFRDARHYFNLVSRSVESFQDIAKLLGDTLIYTDDELYLIVRQLCRDNYGNARAEILPMEAKRKMARTLHFDYKATDKQIQRMLRLDVRILSVFLGK